MSAALDVLSRHGLHDAEVRLREYLSRQRWFGGREWDIRSVRVADVGVVKDGDPAVLTVIVDVDYADAEPERYHVPLAVQREGAAGVWEGVVVGAGERDGQSVVVYDALHGGEPSFALWEAVAAAAVVDMERGRLVCRNNGLELGDTGAEAVRPLGREQSNTSLVRGDLEVMKCFRKLTRGRSPELEMLEALGAAGFENVAAPLGMIVYADAGDQPSLVAMVQPYLHNGTDGWTLACASLRDLYAHSEEMDTRERRHAIRVVREQGASFESESERLARVTARMHLALSRVTEPDDMRPQPADRDLLRRWSAEMLEDLDEMLGRGGEKLDDLRDRREPLVAAFKSITSMTDGGLAIRYHGDYHLGQLLRTDSGWTILDFEGEPARGATARRSRSSPLRDVAGMMRSFDYAAGIEMRNWGQPGDADYGRLAGYGEAWASLNREIFWNSYLDELGDSHIIPSAEDGVGLRRAFELQKGVYEVAYELAHRPDWVDIPLGFLVSQADLLG